MSAPFFAARPFNEAAYHVIDARTGHSICSTMSEANATRVADALNEQSSKPSLEKSPEISSGNLHVGANSPAVSGEDVDPHEALGVGA